MENPHQGGLKCEVETSRTFASGKIWKDLAYCSSLNRNTAGLSAAGEKTLIRSKIRTGCCRRHPLPVLSHGYRY